MPPSTAIAFNPLTKAADVAAQVLTLSPVAVLIIISIWKKGLHNL